MAEPNTDPLAGDPPADPVADPLADVVDEDLDTSEADRDELSTDDGLAAAAAAGMPVVEERDTPPGEDATPPAERVLLDHPDLDVDDDGADPCAALGHCAEDDVDDDAGDDVDDADSGEGG